VADASSTEAKLTPVSVVGAGTKAVEGPEAVAWSESTIG